MGDSQLTEILSWRLAAEFWRRFPHQYALAETHPGGGTYNCLSFISLEDNSQSVLDINRNGSVHVLNGRSPQSWSDWTVRMLADPRAFLDEVTDAVGAAAPERLPRSTAPTVVVRFIGEFLSHSIGRAEAWECRNGFCDTSGEGGGRRNELFACFPQIDFVSQRQAVGGRQLGARYGYWFVLKDVEPMLCVDMAGRLYRRDGKVCDVAESYFKTRRIWSVIAETALDLLP